MASKEQNHGNKQQIRHYQVIMNSCHAVQFTISMVWIRKKRYSLPRNNNDTITYSRERWKFQLWR